MTMIAKLQILQMDFVTVVLAYFLTVTIFIFNPCFAAHITDSGDRSNAVAGRFVSIPARDYITAFKSSIKLGQCPLVMQDGSIKTCKDEFEGEEVYLPKAATTVDITSVKSSDDILTHIMGGVGFNVGVMGLVGVNPKLKVAVTTDTKKNSLNLVNSYVINKGVMTLHRPRPKFVEADSALFLSEIELGGNEMLLVTLGFESEAQKIAVELTVTFKILFISISAKMESIQTSFDYKANCRIQFKSSWRKDLDEYFSDLSACIPRVKEIEAMYLKGPSELREMDSDDERSHYFYHFSSWKQSPFGAHFNLATINHDLESLTEQNTEIKAVIERINKMKDQSLPNDVKDKMLQLNSTLTDMTQRITTGLKDYHKMKPEEREQLRNIYGQNKAPLYYDRYLERIVSTSMNF